MARLRRGNAVKDGTARRLSALHRMIFRSTGGRIGKRLVDNDMLLVTTVGRITAKSHTVPLLYLTAGDAVVVIASWGGRSTHPEWFLNLQAEPTVWVEMHGRRFEGHAEVLAEPERSEWWEAAVSAFGGYAEYQSRTGRVIPVVRIRPR